VIYLLSKPFGCWVNFSCGATLAIRDHTLLWERLVLNCLPRLSTYPRGMDGWVDCDCLLTYRDGLPMHRRSPI